MSKEGTKTAYARVGLWFNEATGHIHLSIPGQGLSTVNAVPESRRGHPHLFNKLAKVLRDQGKHHPAIIDDWKDA